ncbi:MAG: hypothetical protein J6O24_06655 [Succinivibrio sp.]|nr:hypothetical protein [Succinivibrio sp.]MCI7252274.1 hypothetical protein [Succinatimonas sp.]MDD6378077.1 hypothetical protein [Succinatimonas sp.]PWM83002.1 MAG: hypothetical protein DBY31_02490 [Succinivibrio sp.]
MACFTACVAEAIVAYGVKKVVASSKNTKVNSFAPKLQKLINLLLSGSFLLLIEHVWHGEIVPFYPFFTAAKDPESTRVMINEILTIGVSMDIAVTVIWFVAYILVPKFKKQGAIA